MPGKTVWHNSHDAPVRSASMGIACAGAGRRAAMAQTPPETRTTSAIVAKLLNGIKPLFIPHHPSAMHPCNGRDAFSFQLCVGSIAYEMASCGGGRLAM